MRGQTNPVRTKGIGGNQIRTRAQVRLVDLLDQLGPREAHLVEALAVQHAALVERSPHRAVEDQATTGERVDEWTELRRGHDSRANMRPRHPWVKVRNIDAGPRLRYAGADVRARETRR